MLEILDVKYLYALKKTFYQFGVSTMAKSYFNQSSFKFLQKLSKNNNRDWFNEHKQEYEDEIRTPALIFIADMSDDLATLSPHFYAVPKKVGGSLMRVYRDVRFSKDKTPYKTHVGIQFRHAMGKDVHSPGFYLHVEKSNCFVGVGIWRPDSSSLSKIREYIVAKEKQWLAASLDKKFRKQFDFTGESLINAPRGYAKDHPLLEDLKRKDYIALSRLTDEEICSPKLKSLVLKRFQAGEPLMKFLCKALEVNY